jgi:hypothetical protein
LPAEDQDYQTRFQSSYVAELEYNNDDDNFLSETDNNFLQSLSDVCNPEWSNMSDMFLPSNKKSRNDESLVGICVSENATSSSHSVSNSSAFSFPGINKRTRYDFKAVFDTILRANYCKDVSALSTFLNDINVVDAEDLEYCSNDDLMKLLEFMKFGVPFNKLSALLNPSD